MSVAKLLQDIKKWYVGRRIKSQVNVFFNNIDSVEEVTDSFTNGIIDTYRMVVRKYMNSTFKVIKDNREASQKLIEELTPQVVTIMFTIESAVKLLNTDTNKKLVKEIGDNVKAEFADADKIMTEIMDDTVSINAEKLTALKKQLLDDFKTAINEESTADRADVHRANKKVYFNKNGNECSKKEFEKEARETRRETRTGTSYRTECNKEVRHSTKEEFDSAVEKGERVK